MCLCVTSICRIFIAIHLSFDAFKFQNCAIFKSFWIARLFSLSFSVSHIFVCWFLSLVSLFLLIFLLKNLVVVLSSNVIFIHTFCFLYWRVFCSVFVLFDAVEMLFVNISLPSVFTMTPLYCHWPLLNGFVILMCFRCFQLMNRNRMSQKLWMWSIWASKKKTFTKQTRILNIELINFQCIELFTWK